MTSQISSHIEEKQYALQATAALASALPPLNSALIFVALVPIRDHFHISTGLSAWLITAYFIGSAATQPVGGKLGDIWGRKRVFIIGLVYMGLASFFAAISPSFELLLFFRINQAIAGGLIVPNAIAQLREFGPAATRGRSFGLVAAAIGVATGIGPVLSGLTISFWGWRSVFALSFPVILIALILALRSMPRDKKVSNNSRLQIGSPLLMVGFFASLLLFGRFLGSEETFTITSGYQYLIFAVLCAFVFIFWERHTDNPLINMEIFDRRSGYLPGAITILLLSICTFTSLAYIPIYIQDVLGSSERNSGFILGIVAIFTVGFSPITGLISDRVGRKPVVLVGASIYLVSALMGNGLTDTTAWPFLILMMCFWGMGQVCVSAPTEAAAMESLPPRLAGAAAGMYPTMRYVGAIIGTTFLAACLGSSGFSDLVRLHALTAFLTIAAIGCLVAASRLQGRDKKTQS